MCVSPLDFVRCRYFECLVMIHKLLLLIVVAFLPSGSPQQMMLALLETLIFFGVFSLLSPYNELRDTFLFALTQLAIFCQLLEGLLTKLDTSPLMNWVVVVRVLPFGAMMIVVTYALVIISVDIKNKAAKSAQEMKEKLRDLTMSIFGEGSASDVLGSAAVFGVSKKQKKEIRKFVARSVTRRAHRSLTRRMTEEAKMAPGSPTNADDKKGEPEDEEDALAPLEFPTITIQRGRGKKTFTRSESQLILEAVNRAFEEGGSDEDDSDDDGDNSAGKARATAKVSPLKVVPVLKKQEGKPKQMGTWMDRHVWGAASSKVHDSSGMSAGSRPTNAKLQVSHAEDAPTGAIVDTGQTGMEMVPLSVGRDGERRKAEKIRQDARTGNSQAAHNSKRGPESPGPHVKLNVGLDESVDLGADVAPSSAAGTVSESPGGHGKQHRRHHQHQLRDHHGDEATYASPVDTKRTSSRGSAETKLQDRSRLKVVQPTGHNGASDVIGAGAITSGTSSDEKQDADIASVFSPSAHHTESLNTHAGGGASTRTDIIHVGAGARKAGRRRPRAVSPVDLGTSSVSASAEPQIVATRAAAADTAGSHDKPALSHTHSSQGSAIAGADDVLDDLEFDVDDFKKHDFVDI